MIGGAFVWIAREFGVWFVVRIAELAGIRKFDLKRRQAANSYLPPTKFLCLHPPETAIYAHIISAVSWTDIVASAYGTTNRWYVAAGVSMVFVAIIMYAFVCSCCVMMADEAHYK